MPAQLRAGSEVAGDAPTRRLRRKTRVGHLALGLAVVGLAAGLTGPAAPAPPSEWQDTFLAGESLEAENVGKRKSVYLVTLPHPRVARGGEGNAGLKAPGDPSREDVAKLMIAIFDNPQYVDAASASRSGPSLTLERLAVFRELHGACDDGVAHAHYHIAVAASGSFRFMPHKRALRARGFASHWSCTHDGYWSAVRYGVIPTPRKPPEALDATPCAWARQGAHPSLFDAAQEPTTGPALRRRREAAVTAASAAGDKEPRATELDLYSIIVQHDIRNTPDAPWAEKRLIQHVKEHGTPALVHLTWKLRPRLSALIDDVWSWERVGESLAWLGKSRIDTLVAAAQGACERQGVWRHCAEWALHANQVDPGQVPVVEEILHL